MAKTDTGFIDEGNKGFAVRRLKRGPDGTVYVIFVDAKTGKEVQDPGSYNIIEQGHQVDMTSETPQEEKEEDKSLTEELIKNRGESGDYSASRQAVGDFNREMSNNYGYYNAPNALGLAGFMPGPIGLAGKAVNLGVGVNNEGAVNSARDMLGMKEKGLFDTVKSMIGNKDGYIGDVTYGDVNKSVPVGFEGADKYGRTTLTPNEARMRQQLSPNFQEASPEITKSSVKSFKQENPNQQGLLGGLFDNVRNAFTSMFDQDRTLDREYAYGGDTSVHPDAPNLTAETVTQNSRTQTDPKTSDAYRDSKQARDTIDSGTKGLW